MLPPDPYLPSAAEARGLDPATGLPVQLAGAPPPLLPPPDPYATLPPPTDGGSLLPPPGPQDQQPGAGPPEPGLPQPQQAPPDPYAGLTGQAPAPIYPDRPGLDLMKRGAAAQVEQEQAHLELQKVAQLRVDASRAAREQEREQEQVAIAEAEDTVTTERKELSDMAKRGNPPMEGKRIAALAVGLLGEALAQGFSRGKIRGQFSQVTQQQIQGAAADWGAKLAGQREALGLAGDEVEAAEQSFQDSERLSLLGEAEIYKQLGDEARLQASHHRGQAAELAYLGVEETARASEAAAVEKARRQRLTDTLTVSKIEANRARTMKTDAEARKLDRRGRGGASDKGAQFAEAHLRSLPPKERERVRTLGIRGKGGEHLQNPDGTYIKAADKAQAKELNSQHASLLTANDSVMRLEALRSKYGHEFDASNSAALQDMKGTMADLELQLKSVYKLGVLSDSDLAMLQKITGGDPTGWFSKKPTWGAMRERMEGAFKRKLTGLAGYKGDYRLQRAEKIKRLKPEQYRQRWSKAYSPKAGVPSVKSRFAAVKQEQTALKERFGGATGKDYIILATQGLSQYIENEHPAVMDRIDADVEKAEAAGDDNQVDKLMEAWKEEKAFARRLGIERTRLRRQQGEAADKSRKGKAMAEKYSAKAPQFPWQGGK